MVDTSSRNSKPSWNLDDVVVYGITSCIVLAILAVGAGIGWCLGALAGQTLELLDAHDVVHHGGILGGVGGFGSTLYLCFRRLKPAYSGRTISEEEAREKWRKHDGLVCQRRGWDHCITDIGEVEIMVCPVCNEVMDVEQNIPGIPRYSAFLVGMASDHDLFLCKFRRESWHQQALELLKMAEEAASLSLQHLLEEEARAILKDRKSTKKSWKGCGSRSCTVVDE